jgi:hypothetical protein
MALVVGRTLSLPREAWLGRDYENRTRNALAFLKLADITNMLRKLNNV